MKKTAFVTDALDLIRSNVKRDRTADMPLSVQQHLDVGETAFMERQLESVEARLYEKKFRELKYRTLIPISNRDGAGAQNITYYMYTKIGMAAIIANPSDDLPRSDVFAKRFTQPVFQIGTSFGYSTLDLRRAMFTGVPLEMFKVDAARRGVRELESTLCWTGSVANGIVGLFGNANIPSDQAPLGAAASRLWSLKTPDEILKDVLNIITAVRTATKGVQQANTMLLPIAQYNILAGTPRNTFSDTTL
jgi:hypothetical protein